MPSEVRISCAATPMISCGSEIPSGCCAVGSEACGGLHEFHDACGRALGPFGTLSIRFLNLFEYSLTI